MRADSGLANSRPPGGAGVTRFATRGEHRLSYESSGAADGIPVLALHDLLADRGQFRTLGDELPADVVRLTLPDARGHGAAPMISARAYPVQELVADTLAVLDAEHLAAVHIAAVGWGAATAIGLSLLTPERVASLVLADPYLPGQLGHTEHLEQVRAAADAAERGQIDRALDLYLGMRLGADWQEALPKARLGAMRRAAASLAPHLTGMLGASIEWEALGRLTAPVTLLTTTAATAAESETVDALASRLPTPRVVRIRASRGETSPIGGGWLPAFAQALLSPRG